MRTKNYLFKKANHHFLGLKKIVRITFFLSFYLSTNLFYCQDGSLDLTFNSLTQFNNSTGTNLLTGEYTEGINTLATQSDGKVIIGGEFTSINGVNNFRIARINTDGSLDTTFNNGSGIYASNPNTNSRVNKVVLQPDGKIIVGCLASTYYNGVLRYNILRLTSDGTLDTTFNTGSGIGYQMPSFSVSGFTFIPSSFISDIKFQSDGKIILVGDFESYNGSSVKDIMRLNPNGSLDATFNASNLQNANPDIRAKIDAVEVQNDNKIILSIRYTSYNTSVYPPKETSNIYLKRLSQNGALDTTFSVNNTLFSSEPLYSSKKRIEQIKYLSNTKIIISGSFSTAFGNNNPSIIRLNTNGTIDVAFSSGTGAVFPSTVNGASFTNGNIKAFDIQSDGKIIIGGEFVSYNDTNCNGILRINSNGTFDSTFISGTGILNGGKINTMQLIPNNKLMIGGSFEYYNGIQRKSLARINSIMPIIPIIANNDTGTSLNGIASIAVSNVLNNDTYNNLPATISNVTLSFISSTNTGITLNTSTGAVNIAASVPVGTYTLTYQICAISNPTNCATATVTVTVNAQVINANNDDFTSTPISYVNGGTTSSVTTNDTLNGIAVNNSDITISLVNNGGLSGATINGLGIINVPVSTSVGSYTLTYQICQISNPTNCDQASVIINVNEPVIITPDLVFGIRANSYVKHALIQSDGKIIIGGAFTTYNNLNTYRIARLNTDLTLDQTYNTSGPITQMQDDMKIQPDNKVIVVGAFAGFNGGSNGKGLARLNTDGSIDANFNVGGEGVNTLYKDRIRACAIQADGKILLGGGYIKTYNGVGVTNMIRINADGTLDETFVFPFTVDVLGNNLFAPIFQIVVQPDGKILVSGVRNNLPNSQPNFFRLMPNGSIDSSFTIGNTGTDVFQTNCTSCLSPIQSIVLQPDGKILLAGAFDSYNGNTNYKNIVRLLPNGDIDTSLNDIGSSTDRVIKDITYETATGKMFIGGEFTTFKGNNVNKLIRLNQNGSLDSTFSSGTGTTHTNTSSFVYNNIQVIKKQGDGKVILGGSFTSYNGISALNITRIQPTVPGGQAKGIELYESEPEIDNNESISGIKIYPNPSNSIFNIDLTENNDEFDNIEIFNLLGELIYKQKIETRSIKLIDFSNIQSGYYIARIFNKNKSTQVKLIKK